MATLRPDLHRQPGSRSSRPSARGNRDSLYSTLGRQDEDHDFLPYTLDISWSFERIDTQSTIQLPLTRVTRPSGTTFGTSTLADHDELHEEIPLPPLSHASTLDNLHQYVDVETQTFPQDVPARQASMRHNRPKSTTKDPNLVTWTGPDDPENPKNWTIRQKWVATFIVSGFAFLTPLSSSMVAPASMALARELNITNSVEEQLPVSIFVLAFAVGPLIFGPLSESFGRARVLLASSLFYFAWNLGCGFAQTSAQLIVFRFLSGIGGSAPLAIGGGVISDCWHPEQRGQAVGIYSLAPFLGPVVGPIAGGFIAQYSTWRWVFWSTSIVAGLIQVAGFVFLAESHVPTILRRRRNRLVKETGNTLLHTAFDNGQTSTLAAIGGAMMRPTRMLATQPIVQIISLYFGYLFGLFYLVLTTFDALFAEVYHESIGIGGLNYIALGIGFVVGAQTNSYFSDRIYMLLKSRHPEQKGQPEFRIPPTFVGAVLIPIGLFWYGWSAQARVHWIMPDIGIGIFAAGAIVCFQCMSAYMIDAYARFAASGMASAVVLRSLAGFGFPLFAGPMYNTLHYGWGNSLLAFVGIVVGVPASFLFWKYGARLRGMSKYAAG